MHACPHGTNVSSKEVNYKNQDLTSHRSLLNNYKYYAHICVRMMRRVVILYQLVTN